MEMINLLDSVIIVDDTDHPIGVMDKYEAHRHGATLHRAISVYIFRNSGSKSMPKWELLVQQRSLQKIVGGGMWANTVCGNVRPGESYRECAYRRLKQELGLSSDQIEAVQLEEVYKFQYFVQCNDEFSEREMDQIFVCIANGDLALTSNVNEVIDTCWIDFDKLSVAAGNEQKMSQLVKESVGKKLADMTIAPWFMLMMQSKEIRTSITDYLKKSEYR